ncbi:MAG: DUF3596 domain-containing protein [Amphritea sp.]
MAGRKLELPRGVTVRRFKTSESIQINFAYKGIRCRETLRMPPTAGNIRYAEQRFRGRGMDYQGNFDKGCAQLSIDSEVKDIDVKTEDIECKKAKSLPKFLNSDRGKGSMAHNDLLNRPYY